MKINLKEVALNSYAWFCVLGAMLAIWLVSAQNAFADMEGSVDAGVEPAALMQWELIVSLFVPFVAAVVIKNNWNQQAQAAAMLVVAAVVTIVTLYLQGELDWDSENIESYLKVVALTITYYKGIWKPLGTAPTIQNRINP